MKKHYLCCTLLVILIACSVLFRSITQKASLKKPTLPENHFSNVGLKHSQPADKGSLPDSALATIYSSIAAREYNVTKDPISGIPQSPNRKQNLRAYYKPGKFTIKNRVDSAGHDFKLSLTTEGVYANNKRLFISPKDTATTISGNKIQLRQGILTEEYVNSEAGVRQNFIIRKAPEGTKELQVKLAAEGLNVKDLQNNKLQFSSNDKGPSKLTYDGLKCWDANGKDLPATLSYKNGLVEIAVNTSSAAFPVTIDPIVTSGNPGNANALLFGKQEFAEAGKAVASAGDVNGDGFSDVVVGAPNYDLAKAEKGAFFIYFGSSAGLNPNGGILVQGDNYMGNIDFGGLVSGAGDVNGDGYGDVIVGSGSVVGGLGAIYLYYGMEQGLNLNATRIESIYPGALFGKSSISTAGDLNGDGYSDIIVGASLFSNGQEFEGAAFVFMGSPTGISQIAADTLESNQANSLYGKSVGSAGDVNGDGFSDVIVGAPAYDAVVANGGAAFVYLGSQNGLQKVPHVQLNGQQMSSAFGMSVSSAGDLNADGYSDILVGSPDFSNGQSEEGAVYVYLAASQGQGIQSQANHIIEGGQIGGDFGRSVACAGDINGDGFSDIIIGEPSRDDAGKFGVGWAQIYFGSVTGNLSAKSLITSDQGAAYLGSSVASAGDVNGDGFSDIIIGAPLYDKSVSETDNGAALIFYGSSASVETNFSAQVISDQADAEMGYSVSDAGDVNGDGYDDVIVGAFNYDQGGAAFIYFSDDNGINLNTVQTVHSDQLTAQMGVSVSGAGDVNGDGYDDVIVGAPKYDAYGIIDSGVALIYYGSATGIFFGNAGEVTLPKSGAQVGTSVSAAGDLNADGFDDVIVGVPLYDDAIVAKRGAFIISYGSKTGIKNGLGTTIKGNQSSSRFGNSVASGGDINGDGYDDVIVGAYQFNNNPNTQNEGAAFVYYGGLYGLGTSGDILDLNKSKALAGWAVSGVGDVNGDGFADVVVGAKNYSNGENNEGAVAIFYGSQSGIKGLTPTILESNQADALMGSSVGAGDVNGDGYTDVLVGATAYTADQVKEGAVLVYHGSENGIITSAAAVIGGNQINSEMGVAVSSAGDVNGDGFEDVIAGAYKFSGTGRAFVYHGNGDGISVNNDKAVRGNIRLYNSDLTTNINKDNLGKDEFGIGLYAKSFLGRNKGKVVWEIIGQGESFSHASPITNSTQFSGQGNSTDLPITETELKSLVTKSAFLNKVRARVKFSPVLAITGQVYGPWRYANSSVLADPSVLPVELISFNAKAIERQVDLTWETATEVNSDYFELQRSLDGKDWEQLGLVYSSGDSKHANSYSFIDFKPEIGLNYYRLKMVDRDKTFAYSSIKSVNVEGKETRVFPNPVLNTLNIDSNVLDTEVVIYDVSGNELISQKDEKGIKAIDVSKLIPGKYLVKLKNKSFHIIKK
ncbi:FG-GAP-like repeat-containing protein [Dyadobacter sp. CY326]|uniref:FG-GAP-like repeat-containing protein n=1 Tax=Dyadobacter sp. CY326 TaxID=2907300 RepID=UPI001F4541F9|nr:FG-GAP-like repeat-containing protein [Dyadobacter sp. CY326]MCE7067362.1 FG-GAP-like repeat-containing protein [Dyadobacter sp. CY326]